MANEANSVQVSDEPMRAVMEAACNVTYPYHKDGSIRDRNAFRCGYRAALAAQGAPAVRVVVDQNLALVIARLEQITDNTVDDLREAVAQALVCARAAAKTESAAADDPMAWERHYDLGTPREPAMLAEIHGWRERKTPVTPAAGAVDDAARYRWLKERFTGYDFFFMGDPEAETEEGKGKIVIVFEVGQDFNGGRNFEAAIDAAISAQQGPEGKQ